jgi:hypothetical protein
MAEYGNNNRQTVPPLQPVIFDTVIVPCTRGLISPLSGGGAFTVSGKSCSRRASCPCCMDNTVEYEVSFGCNVAVSEGGTAGPISLALQVRGTTYPISTVISTPAAAEEFNAVSKTLSIPILKGCCSDVALINTSTQDVDVQNAVIKFKAPANVVGI